jgi:hypothetical protein
MRKTPLVKLCVLTLLVIVTLLFPLQHTEAVDCLGLCASVALGTVNVARVGANWQGSLINLGNYTTAPISVPQNSGYFIRLLKNDVPASGVVEVSMQLSNGSWTTWADFNYGDGSGQVPLINGVMTIDFTKWSSVPVGQSVARFRIKSDPANVSNSIIVNAIPANMTDYFPYNPGDYFIMVGIANNLAYTTTVNVEEPYILSATWQGRTQSITSEPLRFTLSNNNPWLDGDKDYTVFLSAGFDSFGGIAAEWAFQSVFYNRPGVQQISKKTANRNTVFFPHTVNSWPPPDIYLKQTLDLVQGLDTTGIFDSINITPTFYGGTIPILQVPGVVTNTGWKTAYKFVTINHPHYSGPAVRVRYWEFVTDSIYDDNTKTCQPVSYNADPTIACSVNNDDWYYVKNLGIVAIDSQGLRAPQSPCLLNTACRDQNAVMTSTPFSARLQDVGIFSSGEQVNFQVGTVGLTPPPNCPQNIPYGSSLSIPTGCPYRIRVTRPDGAAYTGFLEIWANINGGPFGHAVFKHYRDANGSSCGTLFPVWVENGEATVQTCVSQAKGTVIVGVRPYVYTELTYTPGSELSTVNPLGWSSPVAVTHQ